MFADCTYLYPCQVYYYWGAGAVGSGKGGELILSLISILESSSCCAVIFTEVDVMNHPRLVYKSNNRCHSESFAIYSAASIGVDSLRYSNSAITGFLRLTGFLRIYSRIYHRSTSSSSKSTMQLTHLIAKDKLIFTRIVCRMFFKVDRSGQRWWDLSLLEESRIVLHLSLSANKIERDWYREADIFNTLVSPQPSESWRLQSERLPARPCIHCDTLSL